MNFNNIISNSESLLYSDSCLETPVIGIINDFLMSESPSKATEDVEYTQILDDSMLDYIIDFDQSPLGRKRKQVRSIQKVHKCGECGWTFTRGYDLKRHMYRHNGVYPYNCHCGKGYYRKDLFLGHLHRHQQESTCDRCGLTFINMIDMKRHSYQHTGFPYKCSCGEGFSRKDLFFNHERKCSTV